MGSTCQFFCLLADLSLPDHFTKWSPNFIGQFTFGPCPL